MLQSHRHDFQNILRLFKNMKEDPVQIEQFGKTSAALAKFLKAMATLDVTLKSGVYDPDDVAETLRDLTTDVLAMEMAVNNLVRR